MKIASILVISVLAAGLIGISSDNAFAQSYSSVLVFDPIPSSVVVGDTIIFSGQLLTSDGEYVISNQIILIKDDVRFGSDYILGEVETDENGEFYAEWINHKLTLYKCQKTDEVIGFNISGIKSVLLKDE